jgi:DNA primase
VFDDSRFKCFGCGEHGDVIDFVQKLHGLSFPDALRHLGIELRDITPEAKRNIKKRKVEKQKAEAQAGRERDLQNTLLLLVRATHKAKKVIKTIEDFERYGDILQPLAWWEYNLERLSAGTEKERFQVFEQFKDMDILPTESLFNKEFDHDDWLKKRDAEDEWEISLHVAGSENSSEETPASR